MSFAIDLCERGLIPDSLTRIGIRKLLRQRLADTDLGSKEKNFADARRLAAEFRDGPIALVPEKANEQHYEVPADLFGLMLGPNRKYSGCFWPVGCLSLESAELAALEVTCERAELIDGQRILELGCGWGSLSLYMAKEYPNALVTAVSNSTSQRDYIVGQANSRGINNLKVITCDINDFDVEAEFDRIVSVEMFEHMRNYEVLLRNISRWLTGEGKLFVHIFCHKELTYKFEDRTASDWMSRYFFSGGVMPAADFLSQFDKDLKIVRQWNWNGEHYQKTCEAWLANMDRNRTETMAVLRKAYGVDAKRWFNRWRIFNLACSELFGFDGGNEWYVSHYLFEK